MRLLLLSLIGILAAIVPASAHAELNHVLVGNGFGVVDGNIESSSLHASIQVQDSGKPVFQTGRLVMGDDTYEMNNASILLFHNEKFLRFNAETDSISITASGKLVALLDDDHVYQLTGRTSNHDSFSIFVQLKQDSIVDVDSDKNAAKKEMLLLVKQTDRVEWKSPYEFTVRTFDPKSNSLADFYSSSGYLEGVKISATVVNPIGNVIKTSDGLTQKFGYYDDSVIIPDNAITGIYRMNVTASGESYQSITREFTFVVTP